MDLRIEFQRSNLDSATIAQQKRANKPLVEKKRRIRINKSIDELKAIVLQAMNKDDKDYCKMEKADILEMVVRHLRTIRKKQLASESIASCGSIWNNYRLGFNECASEVMTYLKVSNGVDHTIQLRMLQHLSDCVNRVNVIQGHQQIQESHPGKSAPISNHLPANMVRHIHGQMTPECISARVPSLNSQITTSTMEQCLPRSTGSSESIANCMQERITSNENTGDSLLSLNQIYSYKTRFDQIVPESQSLRIDTHNGDRYIRGDESSIDTLYQSHQINGYYKSYDLVHKMKTYRKHSYDQLHSKTSSTMRPQLASVWRPW